MNKNQKLLLANTITNAARDGILSVINGESPSFEIDPFKPYSFPVVPALVEKILEPLGWKEGELETNGWEYDWWLPFTKDGKSFTAHGSGYYGGFNFAPTVAL